MVGSPLRGVRTMLRRRRETMDLDEFSGHQKHIFFHFGGNEIVRVVRFTGSAPTVEPTNSDTLDVASDQPLKTRYIVCTYKLDLKFRVIRK